MDNEVRDRLSLEVSVMDTCLQALDGQVEDVLCVGLMHQWERLKRTVTDALRSG